MNDEAASPGRDAATRPVFDWSDPLRLDDQLSAEERASRGYGSLPRTLLEAAEALAHDPLARSVLGPALHEDYVAAKRKEWEEFHQGVSDWERDRYLEAL